MKIDFSDINRLETVGRKVLNYDENARVFAFFGQMGIGKTTLIKAICKLLNVQEYVTSPTFPIINEYMTKDGEPVYHFDFYRIRNDEEIFELGYEDYFYSGYYCFIEWGENIFKYLPKNFLHLDLKEENDKKVLQIK